MERDILKLVERVARDATLTRNERLRTLETFENYMVNFGYNPDFLNKEFGMYRSIVDLVKYDPKTRQTEK